MRKTLESLWGAAQMALHIALGPVLHRWRTRWGATPDECRRRLPGDELVPLPDWSYTHAITIDAPRSAVWPWLVQLGQGRGGFYSYEGLENLCGCDIHNVSEIRPELQRLRPGDKLRMHARSPGAPVRIVEPGHALVLGAPPAGDGSGATWAFRLLSGPGESTRLIERGRNRVGKGLLAKLAFGPYLIDPVGFVMSKRMLRTIKRLAEQRAHRT
ncbi:MAG TPA: hypothetical protein VKA84_10940 [Gemmatimonadaceae bacterium]|nr:hypothetical protein [Gemmatimonadaceae bacterium]